jgi:PAS domain-containing protein
MINLLNGLAVLSASASILYFIKSFEKKDLTYLSSALSRLYLTGVLVVSGNFNNLFQIGMDDSLVALIAVLISDIFVMSVYLASKKYVKEIEHAKAITRLKDMSEKFSVIIESAVTGFFTLSQDGTIEFANQSLANLLEISRGELIGKSLFSFLKDPCVKENFFLQKFSCANVYVVTKTGKELKVYISGGRTRNGHETITGSIIELN